MTWRDLAACRGSDWDLFVPVRGEPVLEAKEVCRGCVVREDCLEYALANGEKFGIWGGMSERERRRIRRRRFLDSKARVMGTDLTLLDLLAERPGRTHRDDPETSREAAAKVKVGPLQRKVLMALYRAFYTGATDQELGLALNITATSAGTRRKELADVGLVEVTAERRFTPSGNKARVHRLTDEGCRVAAEVARTW